MRYVLVVLLGIAVTVGYVYAKSASRDDGPPPEWMEPPELPPVWGKVGSPGPDVRSTYYVQLTAGSPQKPTFGQADENLAIEILQESPSPGLWLTYKATRLVDGERRLVGHGSARIDRIHQTTETIDGRPHYVTTYEAHGSTLRILDDSPWKGHGKPSIYRAEVTGRLARIFDADQAGDRSGALELRARALRRPWAYRPHH